MNCITGRCLDFGIRVKRRYNNVRSVDNKYVLKAENNYRQIRKLLSIIKKIRIGLQQRLIT